MVGKPAHTVVDSETVEAVLGRPGTVSSSGSAAHRFLSAPPMDPISDGVTDSGASFADAIDEVVDRGSPALLDDGARLHGAGEPAEPVPRPRDVTEALAVRPLLGGMGGRGGPVGAQSRPAAARWDASDIVTEIYAAHYGQLVRLALLLVHDVQTAEEVVQDAFEAMHLAWRRLRDSEKALSYLRQTVVNRSRSVLRHRKVVDLHAPKPAPDEPSAEHAALTLIERSAVIAALRLLPGRQREAIVLRYYLDLGEADIAQAMGISRGAVKSHTARALAALKSTLEQEPS